MNLPAVDRVIQRNRACSRTPFPTEEIAKVVPNDAATRSVFHGRVDLFLSGIAGYASSADRLQRRGTEALLKARQFLSEGFFERYGEYVPIRERINPQETPTLFLEMESAELNRVDLLEEVNRILESAGV